MSGLRATAARFVPRDKEMKTLSVRWLFWLNATTCKGAANKDKAHSCFNQNPNSWKWSKENPNSKGAEDVWSGRCDREQLKFNALVFMVWLPNNKDLHHFFVIFPGRQLSFYSEGPDTEPCGTPCFLLIRAGPSPVNEHRAKRELAQFLMVCLFPWLPPYARR